MHTTEQTLEEKWGDLDTCSYWLEADDGGRIAITRIAADPKLPKRAAVVLVPGMFSNRHFWVSPKGIGLAAAVAAAGSPVWLIERRGLGRSGKPDKARAGLNEHLHVDLPLVQKHVQGIDPGPAIWGGHSFGGVIATRAVAETLDSRLIGGLLLFAAQVEVDKKLLCWPWNLYLRAIARLFGRFPSRKLGLGPEDEPIAAIDDACTWRMNTQRGGNLLAPLVNIHCPVFAFAGGADDRDPPAGCEKLLSHMSSPDKRYVLLSKNNGYSQDYDHPGIVVSKAAAKEVWPQVVDWLAKLPLQAQ
ncbi:MAG: alpha/beta fold hydrolase [Nevskiales bacterium]